MAKLRSLLILNGALTAFLLLMLFLYPLDVLRDYSIKNYPDAYGYAGGAVLYDNACVQQYFTPSEVVDSFDFRIDVVNDSRYGSFMVRLFDENSKVVGKWKVDKLDIKDGWIECRLKSGYMMPDHRYIIEITTEGLDEYNAIKLGLASSEDRADGVGRLVYKPAGKGISSDYTNLVMSFGVYRHRFNIFAALALVILYAVANVFWIFKDKGIEALALPVVIGTGLIMLVMYPFGYGMDERYHFFSAYEISNVILGHENTGVIENKYVIDDDLFVNNNVYDRYIMVLNKSFNDKQIQEGNTDNLAYKNDLIQPISHLAPGIAITLGRIFNVNIVSLYYMARLFNMLSYAIMVFVAVKLIPVNKELMVMLGINPVVLRMATSTSYDGPVNGLTFIFIAYIIKLMNSEQKVSWRDTIICLALLTLLGPIKVIYVILAFLILAIPAEKFVSVSDRTIKSAVVIAGSFVVLVLTRMQAIADVLNSKILLNAIQSRVRLYTSNYAFGMIRPVALLSGIQINELKYTADFAFEQPVYFLKLLFSNAYESIDEVLFGMFGGGLGIHRHIVLWFIILTVLCALSESSYAVKGKNAKAVFLVNAIIGYLAIFYIFMLAETPYGSRTIGGWNPKYFIPFIPQTVFCLCGLRGSLKFDKMNLFTQIWFIEIAIIFDIVQGIVIK